ncbi:MAG: carboxypeptidase regulatory-like domain-containing protein [Chloroflexaceae bacterium]|nr:carboxypeptidase regulatory-like domain-containing protein [Chloroflexaceae bacterium]
MQHSIHVRLLGLLVAVWLLTGCHPFAKPELVFITPQPGTPTSRSQPNQLFRDLCRQQRDTSCVWVEVRTHGDARPVENAIVAVDGGGDRGIIGYTNSEGIYQWQLLPVGVYEVRVTGFEGEKTLFKSRPQQVELRGGQITPVSIFVDLPEEPTPPPGKPPHTPE